MDPTSNLKLSGNHFEYSDYFSNLSFGASVEFETGFNASDISSVVSTRFLMSSTKSWILSISWSVKVG